MTTLLIGISIFALVGLGWYGYKASLRIEAWGQGVDECDRIFQTVSGEPGASNFDEGRQRPPRIAPFVTSHLRPGAAE
jgi:hypothetical protein